MTNASGRIAVDTVPRIYGASELGVLAITAPGEAHPRVEYIGGELFVGLDWSDDRTAVSQGQMQQASRDFPDLLATAIASADRIPAAVDGLIRVEDETLAASVIVDRPRTAAVSLPGTPVVFVLSRGLLVIVGSDDEAAFSRVLDLAEGVYESGVPTVSAHPVALVEGGWAPFPWLESFPALAQRIQRVLRLFGVRAYEAQTAALHRPDVRYLDPKIQVLDSGVTTTFATWPKGTASLLPVVDNVIIADPSGALSVATMDQFLDAGGDAIIRTGLSPARYFVPGEPPRD